MCVDHDSHPPVAPIAGAAVDGSFVELSAADGTRCAAYCAHASASTGAGMIVLPDVRGLAPFYEELALRFAEAGVDSIAIDYFGRTAGAERRGADFDNGPHTSQTTWAGLRTDAIAGAEHLRAEHGVRSLFSVGFWPARRRPRDHLGPGRATLLLRPEAGSVRDGLRRFVGCRPCVRP